MLPFGLSCEEMCGFSEWTKDESPSLITERKVIRCNLENHVPTVVFYHDLRIPDIFSKSSVCK